MEHKTLLEKWRYVMKDSTSPDTFIDWSFYFLIASCLQRRVWIGASHHPIYPGMYVILVGEPGVGKGLMVHELNFLLSYHELIPPKVTATAAGPTMLDPSTKAAKLEESAEAAREFLREIGEDPKKIKTKKRNLLFPLGASCTTYAKLVESLEGAYRAFVYKVPGAENGEMKTMRYTHNSLAFCISELATLFSRDTSTLVTFFTDIWDGEKYIYETKHCGENIIPRPCISFYAGTTPDFMSEAFDNKLIGTGFTARVVFVYETTKRFEKFELPERNDIQKNFVIDILTRLRKLAGIYGHVQYSDEAFAYFKHYFEKIHPIRRPNSSPKMLPYYERKKVHAQKLAMAIHFADNDSLVIEKETCVRVLEVLETVESRMHLALSFGGKNFLAKVAKDVETFIRNSQVPQTFTDIWKEFVGDVKESELIEVLDYLQRTDKITKGETENRKIAYITKR
jgi:hypothetical protein